MMATILLWLGVGIATIAVWSRRRRRSPSPHPRALPSCLIPSYTSHARLLPKPSKHAFSYPLIYVGADIDSLENGLLDIWPIFSFGGSPFSKILGFRSLNYLTLGPGGLRSKLESLLETQGISKESVGRAWLLSMPSYLAFEGINPLSVWYIYDKEGRFMAVVLEVHNTFGEKHAYVLPVESPFAEVASGEYHHSWTFPRAFHVSPFNSRDGFYRLDLIDPFRESRTEPTIKVFLKLLTPDRTPKLWAVLASHPTHRPIALASGNVIRILGAIARWPFTLFLSTPRILYHAYKLHYEKRLAVYPRPEPSGKGAEEEWNTPHPDAGRSGAGIGWQVSGLTENVARGIVLPWLEKRCEDLHIALRTSFRDDRSTVDINTGAESKCRILEIETGDPKFFANLLSARSPEHSLVLAPELLTLISDHELFASVFSDVPSVRGDYIDGWTQELRKKHALYLWKYSSLAVPPDVVRGLRVHWSATLPLTGRIKVLLVVALQFFADWLETEVLQLMGARFVEGHEPWTIWDRALRRQYVEAKDASQDDLTRRSSRSDEWVDLGSVQY